MAASGKKGLSLLEAVIYVSILAVIFVVVVNTITISSSTLGVGRLKRNVAVEAGAALERIVREVRLADGVDESASALATTTGTLVLDSVASAEDDTDTTKTISLEDGVVTLQVGSDSAKPLTSGLVVNKLAFYAITVGTTSEAVTVTMRARDTFGALEVEQNFFATAVLRGSY